MKNLAKQILSGLVITFVLSQSSAGQKDYGFKPAASNIQGADFPKISLDNSVYVRLRAPDALFSAAQSGGV